ncbi:RNase P protein component [Gammaproteobacteria bacterium]
MVVPDQRFQKAKRLLHSRQFEHVFANARKTGLLGLTVLARINDQSHPRLGLIVSKRVEKTAVGRNRIKRLARERFRHLQDQLGCIDLILLARPGLPEKDNATLISLFSKGLLDAARRCRNS